MQRADIAPLARSARESAAKTLVTGASGFVGFAVVRKLIECGHAVRVLTRPTSPKTHLSKLDVEIVDGDLRDAGSVARAMVGVRWLFHVAADYRLWARNPSEIVDNNVIGTRTIMEAAKRAGVERIVYTSSAATIALSADGTPVDESTGLPPSRRSAPISAARSWRSGWSERMVADGLPAVIVNPPRRSVPLTCSPTPTGRIIIEAACGRMPVLCRYRIELCPCR